MVNLIVKEKDLTKNLLDIVAQAGGVHIIKVKDGTVNNDRNIFSMMHEEHCSAVGLKKGTKYTTYETENNESYMDTVGHIIEESNFDADNDFVFVYDTENPSMRYLNGRLLYANSLTHLKYGLDTATCHERSHSNSKVDTDKNEEPNEADFAKSVEQGLEFAKALSSGAYDLLGKCLY